jgi:uncharacterized glyoxalase superfamily protein PhnB
MQLATTVLFVSAMTAAVDFHERALAAGAQPVVSPSQQPWGQEVVRVRDLNGVLVSIATSPKF